GAVRSPLLQKLDGLLADLIGEGFHQCDLVVRKGPDYFTIDDYDAQKVVAFEYRHPQNCGGFCRKKGSCTERILWISRNIGYVDRSPFKRGAGSTGVPARANWILLYKFLKFLRGIVGNRQPKQLAIETVNECSMCPAKRD